MDLYLQKEIICEVKLSVMQIFNKVRMDDLYKKEELMNDLIKVI